MPQIPKHRKVKRPAVLIKKTQYLRNYLRSRSYKPLCEKLKSNNCSLAKALSKEKHESQLLFSQNVALIAEVQDLGTACNKRDAVISNILKNAKEMLKMIVTMTGYLTNTISTCQEFVASPTSNLRMSASSTGIILGDSYRRLSAKSPTRGVVKPMVSGHTITKPTINLSRVNMQHINNSSNLSVIQEVTTPPRNQELNSPRTPGRLNVSQRRNEEGRMYRMPERLNVTSPRHSDESERRLSKRSNRRSGRMSGNISKSRKLSGGNSTRNSIENFEYIGSPTVKLNDVSKLLQNSQSINIRKLTENRNTLGNESLESNESVSPEDSQTSIKLPELSPPNVSKTNGDTTIEDENEKNDDDLNNTSKTHENMNGTQNTMDIEDPLEGPSWLFNNTCSVPSFKYKMRHTFNSFENKDKKTDEDTLSNDDSMDITLRVTELSDESDNEKSSQDTSSLSTTSKCDGSMSNSKLDQQINNENEYQNGQANENNDTSYNASTSTDTTVINENECKVENELAMNFPNFITQRRGCFESEEEDDDFTLMYMRPNNMHFDINDLKLPVLEESALKTNIPVETEPEVTTNLKQITQICPLPSVANNSLDEFTFNQSTVKLPLLNNNDDKEKKKKKSKNVSPEDVVEGTPILNRKSSRKRKDQSGNKDPSAVKVVLQKLNESDVKSRTPSPEVSNSQESGKSLSPCSRTENSSDSENSNTSTSSIYAISRPRRKRAPTTFHEPSLKRKLRRN
ncbi:uncharacterized protein LOC100877238 isoform X1 [Megachile rotundata]|uniref:uncharacterized protein LOC100877238 isoform X1 n=1 Tax=Megachile rotundata TaxID=143995 RepID=UPI003FD1B6F1